MKSFFLILCLYFLVPAYPQDTGVAILAYNRPQYFQVLLESLEKNKESQELPFFFFLDGGENATQEENIALIQKARLAEKHIITRPINFGCPKNHIDAKRFMFDKCGFDRVVILEEDLLVPPTYLKTLLRLHDWAKKHFDNVGTVQLWNVENKHKPRTKSRLSYVRETEPLWSMVTYCMDKEVWNAISPFLYAYESQFIDHLLDTATPFRARSKPGTSIYVEEIREWRQKYIKNHPPIRLNGPRILRSKIDFLEGLYHHYSSLNQDYTTSLAIWLAGYVRLQTLFCHVHHIGKIGISLHNHNENWDDASIPFLEEDDDAFIDFELLN